MNNWEKFITKLWKQCESLDSQTRDYANSHNISQAHTRTPSVIKKVSKYGNENES